MYFTAILLLFALVNCNDGVDTKKERQIKVDVYYESLCPDSKQFVTKQLNPVLNRDLMKRVQLNIYPYGKSTTKKLEDKYEFVCHHGEFECEGNKYHGCALKLIENGDASDNLSFNKKALNYVNCMMENIYLDEQDKKRKAPIDKCKAVLGEEHETVEKCAKNKQGSEFLAEFGNLTDAFQKPLKSVPTIVFDGKYDHNESKEAYENFLKTLCGKFKEEKPADCIEKE